MSPQLPAAAALLSRLTLVTFVSLSACLKGGSLDGLFRLHRTDRRATGTLIGELANTRPSKSKVSLNLLSDRNRDSLTRYGEKLCGLCLRVRFHVKLFVAFDEFQW